MMENERLTHKRVNGIKEGYWSSAKKEALMQRLAEYEDTGFDPEEIKGLVDKIIGLSKLVMADWVPVEEQLRRMINTSFCLLRIFHCQRWGIMR